MFLLSALPEKKKKNRLWNRLWNDQSVQVLELLAEVPSRLVQRKVYEG
jgi:hypothetical protein